MLDPWIIEEIRRREEEERREQPALEIPHHTPEHPSEKESGKKEQGGEGDPPRGVVVVDFRV